MLYVHVSVFPMASFFPMADLFLFPVALQVRPSHYDLSSPNVSGVLGDCLIHFLPRLSQRQGPRSLAMLDGDAQKR